MTTSTILPTLTPPTLRCHMMTLVVAHPLQYQFYSTALQNSKSYHRNAITLQATSHITEVNVTQHAAML